MYNEGRSNKKVMTELTEIQQRVAELEAWESDRELAEQALQNNEEFGSGLLNSFPNPILLLNPDTSVRYVNPSFEKVTGFSPAEIVGKKAPHRWWMEETSQKTRRDLEKVMKKGARRIERLFQHKNGEKLWFEIALIPVFSNEKLDYYLANWVDITERKRAEEVLRESEKGYRNLFEQSKDAVFMTTREGELVYINQSFLELLDYTRKETTDLKAQDTYANPADRSRFQQEIEQNGSVRDFEVKLRKKDGTEIDCLLTATVQKADDAGILGYQGIIRDITEQKVLLRMWRKYEFIVNTSKQFMTLINRSYTYEAVNESYCHARNKSQEELLGSTVADVWGEKHFQTVIKPYLDQCFAGNEVHHQNWFRFKVGERRYYEVSYYPYRGDKAEVTHAVVVTRDITKHKRAQEALKESERRFRLLVEHATDSFFLHEIDGRIRDVNQHACESSGYTREELLGLSIEDIDQDFVPGKHLEKWGQMVPGVPITFEGVHRRKDGTTFPVEVRLGVLESGERQLMLGLVRDISERKRAEEEKQNLEAQLLRAQKMEAIGTLAGGVAHDLNNILSGLVSYPELLLLDLPKDSPLRQPILTIQNSGQKATAIVQDLLTLARRGVAATEVENLTSIVSKYLISPEFGKLREFHPNVKLETDLETDLLPILGSPVHLSKTVMNLVSNAAEAMPHGGEIFISTKNRYIDQPIRGYDRVEEGDYVTLIVSDTGVGIPQKDIEKIFEPFFTKKVMGRSGTGLGMAVVWGTVKDHKGYIDVKSTEGKGTTFTLYFPVTRKESAKDESRLSIEDYRGTGESILVVDDVKEQREIAGQVLKRLGYSVTSVSSGEEAVDYMKDNSADLLVLDMIMDPGIDGLETYKRILELRPGQKAIIVSGFSETERVREAQRLGAGAYVRKPYLLEKFGLAVRDELER